MLNKISDGLYRISSNRLTALSVAIFLLFITLVMPAQSAQAAAYSGEVGSPDTTLFYSAENLRHMAEAYGPAGRQAYIRARFTFDLAFPLVYTFFLATSSSWMLQRLLKPANPWRRLNLLPLAAMLFDFLENICTAVVMAAYPAARPLAANLATIFTPVKWFFVCASFLLLLMGSILCMLRSAKERKEPA